MQKFKELRRGIVENAQAAKAKIQAGAKTLQDTVSGQKARDAVIAEFVPVDFQRVGDSYQAMEAYFNSEKEALEMRYDFLVRIAPKVSTTDAGVVAARMYLLRNKSLDLPPYFSKTPTGAPGCIIKLRGWKNGAKPLKGLDHHSDAVYKSACINLREKLTALHGKLKTLSDELGQTPLAAHIGQLFHLVEEHLATLARLAIDNDFSRAAFFEATLTWVDVQAPIIEALASLSAVYVDKCGEVVRVREQITQPDFGYLEEACDKMAAEIARCIEDVSRTPEQVENIRLKLLALNPHTILIRYEQAVTARALAQALAQGFNQAKADCKNIAACKINVEQWLIMAGVFKLEDHREATTVKELAIFKQQLGQIQAAQEKILTAERTRMQGELNNEHERLVKLFAGKIEGEAEAIARYNENTQKPIDIAAFKSLAVDIPQVRELTADNLAGEQASHQQTKAGLMQAFNQRFAELKLPYEISMRQWRDELDATSKSLPKMTGAFEDLKRDMQAYAKANDKFTFQRFIEAKFRYEALLEAAAALQGDHNCLSAAFHAHQQAAQAAQAQAERARQAAEQKAALDARENHSINQAVNDVITKIDELVDQYRQKYPRSENSLGQVKAGLVDIQNYYKNNLHVTAEVYQQRVVTYLEINKKHTPTCKAFRRQWPSLIQKILEFFIDRCHLNPNRNKVSKASAKPGKALFTWMERHQGTIGHIPQEELAIVPQRAFDAGR